MAPEPWNRLHIPRPAIQSLVTVPVGNDTENHIKEVIKRSIAVQTSLRSCALKTEIATLHSLLYIYHHRLCLHKPYLALKQVGQCIKRLETMGLERSIEEMIELCPKYIGKNGSQMTQSCLVPSQPIIEVVSVKILGACKLLLRLMDCCCKAFHLSLQHLYLEEFMVLNVVLVGLLSRLWVIYMGILKNLIFLYDAQFPLQQEISNFQNMPYIKDFTFPAKMEDYLGPLYSKVSKRKLPKLFSKKKLPKMLNPMFQSHESEANASELMEPAIVEMPETRKSVTDLGRPVKSRTFNAEKVGTFDVKTLLQPLKYNISQVSLSKPGDEVLDVLPHRRHKARCLKPLVPKVQKAECFQDLCEQLQLAATWCKRRRLTAAAMFFRNKYLKSKRLKHIEAQGYSLQNKLHHMKKSICHRLQQGTLKANHRCPRLKTQRFQNAWKPKVTRSRSCKSANSRRGHIIYSQPKTERTYLEKPVLCLDLGHGDQGMSSAVTNVGLTPCVPDASNQSADGKMKDCNHMDDIDDIFSSIGV
ncbi:nucleolus and neural progenitor protein [Spea bombifrons]|uniref:nucleolus and neural progenitor protein n=1 Tax=Spea bombifrons TaxID=233779 RepID=UPI00234BBE57|nr:nucleolus and neural progenitor protein [Spea bombifrons]XP_053311262.1 nucleolus and neural progenitor protein [Spea bombifrons]